MTRPSPVEDLTCRIDDALLAGDSKLVCKGIKQALEEFTKNANCLEERLLRPVADGYGRRLLHRDPARRYTILVMTWGMGQGTPIHYHCGMWCVEGVWSGELEVVQYQLQERDGERYRFRPVGAIQAGLGSAGSLIPPHEYHTICNANSDQPTVSVHVYSGRMTICNIFHPEGDDWYLRQARTIGVDARIAS